MERMWTLLARSSGEEDRNPIGKVDEDMKRHGQEEKMKGKINNGEGLGQKKQIM